MKRKGFKNKFIAVLMMIAMTVTLIPTHGFAVTEAEGTESEPASELSIENASETGETTNGEGSGETGNVEEGEDLTEQDGQTGEFGIQVRINESDWRNVELLETTVKKSGKYWYNATGVLQSSDASLESFNTVKIRGINIPAGQKLVAGTSAVNNSFSFADNRKLSSGNQVDGLYSNTGTTTQVTGARAGFNKGQGPAKDTYYIYAYLADEVTEEIVDESKAWYIKVQRNGYEDIVYANMGFDAVEPLTVNTWSAGDKAVSAMFGTMQYEQNVSFYNDIGDKKNGTLEVLDLNDEFSYDANAWSLKATRPGEHWMRWTCTYTNSDGTEVTKTADGRIMARFEKAAVQYYIGNGTDTNKGAIGNFLADYDESVHLADQKKELEDKYQTLVNEVNAWGINNASIHVKRTEDNPYGTTSNKSLADKDSRGAALKVCDVWADDINAMLDVYEEIQADKTCGKDYAIEKLEEMKNEYDSTRCSAIIDDAIAQIEELDIQEGDAKAKTIQRILNRAEADIQAEEETQEAIVMLKEMVAMLKAELISPNAKAVASGTKSVKLTWTTISYADGYELSGDNGNNWEGLSGAEMTLSGLSPATTYTYQIRGYVLLDEKHYYSKVSTARVTTPLAKAGTPKVKTKSRKLTASWGRVEGASSYQVWIGTNSAVTKGVIKYSTSSLSKTSKKLKKNKNYYVKVRAYKGSVYGAWSVAKKIKCK